MNNISADGFRTLLESIHDGFFIHDEEGRFVDVSAHFCAELGYTRDEFLRMTVNDISPGLLPEKNLAKRREAPAGMAMNFRETAVRKDGSTYPVDIGLTCQIIDGRKLFLGLVCAVGHVVDTISEARFAEASLQRQSLEDPLTGVANRRRLDEELKKACLHATRTGDPLALALVDIDHFKPYNDALGHLAGDVALTSVADILSLIARRPYDLVARYGGEEFVLLLPGVGDPEPVLARIGAELARLRIPHPASPVADYLTVSCGCVVATEMADVDPRDLFAHCDRALYRAKEGGRNGVHIVEI